MATTENTASVRRVLDAWNHGDHAGYLSLYDPDAVLHPSEGPLRGIAAIRSYYEALGAGFPDAQITVERTVSDRSHVAMRFWLRGTHRGPFVGLPPTGKRVEMSGTTILRLVGGRCVERWSETDQLGLLQQLGVIPAPADPV